MTDQRSLIDHRAQENAGQIRPQVPPSPEGASAELCEAVVQSEPIEDRAEMFSKIPQTESEWLVFIEAFDKPVVEGVQATIAQSPITVEHEEIEGVMSTM